MSRTSRVTLSDIHAALPENVALRIVGKDKDAVLEKDLLYIITRSTDFITELSTHDEHAELRIGFTFTDQYKRQTAANVIMRFGDLEHRRSLFIVLKDDLGFVQTEARCNYIYVAGNPDPMMNQVYFNGDWTQKEVRLTGRHLLTLLLMTCAAITYEEREDMTSAMRYAGIQLALQALMSLRTVQNSEISKMTMPQKSTNSSRPRAQSWDPLPFLQKEWAVYGEYTERRIRAGQAQAQAQASASAQASAQAQAQAPTRAQAQAQARARVSASIRLAYANQNSSNLYNYPNAMAHLLGKSGPQAQRLLENRRLKNRKDNMSTAPHTTG